MPSESSFSFSLVKGCTAISAVIGFLAEKGQVGFDLDQGRQTRRKSSRSRTDLAQICAARPEMRAGHHTVRHRGAAVPHRHFSHTSGTSPPRISAPRSAYNRMPWKPHADRWERRDQATASGTGQTYWAGLDIMDECNFDMSGQRPASVT